MIVLYEVVFLGENGIGSEVTNVLAVLTRFVAHLTRVGFEVLAVNQMACELPDAVRGRQ